jgi:nitroreductase
MRILENMNWRYATKKFDAEKAIKEADLEVLKEAVQLSASSYGLQPYKILLIKDMVLRKKLQEVSFMQPQIADADYLVVFCNYTKLGDKEIDEYVRLTGEKRQIPVENLQNFAGMMKAKVSKMSPEELKNWTAKQAYIALGTLLSSAAELRIDACPMEGFQAEKYNEILDLDKENLSAAVIATIGYRSSEDETQFYKKVRKEKADLYKHL